MKILEIKPLEPLSLSLSLIGGVDVYTVTHSTPIPLPTTVAGAIGASMNIVISQTDPMESLNDLINELKKRCGDSGRPLILGPLTCFNEHATDQSKCYAYLHPGRLLSLAEHCIVESNGIVYLKSRSGDRDVCYVDFTPITGVGVSLQRTKPGEEKVVRYGYMYRYPLITFRTPSGRALNPLYIYEFNCEENINAVVRFGGESRVAKLTTRSIEASYLKNIKSPLDELEKGLYIALSPIPVIPLKNDATQLSPGNVELPVHIESILGVPQETRPAKIRITRLGLGFSEAAKKRRPEVLALPPGTLIKVKEDVKPPKFSNLMRNLLYIGFASLYKLR
ncbi:MAG: hypothetical protein QXJ97_03625 [Desulfurococcaceae archaeon]